MPKDDPFATPLKTFRALLKRYEKRCVVDTDNDSEYHLNFKPDELNDKPRFFAGTGVNKATISFYLGPVHSDAPLRASLSPYLKKHLSGKCCFRFKKSEPIPYDELAELAAWGFRIYKPTRRAST